MKVLIVGAGSVGKRHLQNFRALGVPAFGMVDTREDRRQEAAQEPGVVAVHADLGAALAESYDVVVVCAPTASHVPIGQLSLEAGAHVLMEKPLSHTDDGVSALLSLARARNRVLMVGYTYRFWPALIRLKQLLEQGAIGRVLFVDLNFSQYLPDWHPWEDYRSWFMSKREQGGGALLDESHAIDMARWLFGEIQDVFCHSGNLSSLEMTADDYAHLLVTFQSGAKASIHLDVFGRRPRRALDVSGEAGNISCDVSKGELTVYRGDRDSSEVIACSSERNDMFMAEASHFLECIAGRAAPCVSGDDAYRTLLVLMAARRSSVAGCLVSLQHSTLPQVP